MVRAIEENALANQVGLERNATSCRVTLGAANTANVKMVLASAPEDGTVATAPSVTYVYFIYM